MKRPSGFTLLEVMVATAIGAVAIGVGSMGVVALAEQQGRIEEATARQSGAGVAWLVVERLLANLDYRDRAEPALLADSGLLRASSWCDGVENWLVPCVGEIRLESDRHGRRLSVRVVATDTGNELFHFQLGSTPLSIRYLVRPDDGGHWADQWSGLVPPRLVSIEFQTDTLIFAVGAGD